jgi:hypothetical protein
MGRFCFVTISLSGLIMGRMIMGNDVQAFASEYTYMQHNFILPQLIPAFITTNCVHHP